MCCWQAQLSHDVQAYQDAVVADAERALQYMTVHNSLVSSSLCAVVWQLDVPIDSAAPELVRRMLKWPEG